MRVQDVVRVGLMAGALLSGCTTVAAVTDRLTPDRLFGGGVEAPQSESAAVARERAAAAVEEAQDAPYPKLSQVPERPQIASRRGIQEGLVADRRNAAHTGAELRGSGSGVPAPAVSPSRGQAAVRRLPLESTGPAPGTAELAALQEQLALGEPVRVAVIRFGENSAVVDAQDRQVLAEVAELTLATGATVLVVGHASGPADGGGGATSEAANLEISLARANAVADDLAAFGVGRGAIAVQGRGDNEPAEAAPGDDDGSGAGHRRAEVFLRR